MAIDPTKGVQVVPIEEAKRLHEELEAKAQAEEDALAIEVEFPESTLKALGELVDKFQYAHGNTLKMSKQMHDAVMRGVELGHINLDGYTIVVDRTLEFGVIQQMMMGARS